MAKQDLGEDMKSSFCSSSYQNGTVYKGNINTVCDCVAGYLFFVSDIKKMPSFDSATILAVNCNDLSDLLLSLSDTSNVIAIVVIGSANSPYDLREAEHLNIPILTLPSIPEQHHGKIAILDPSISSLFVDPDIDTLSKYLNLFGSVSNELYDSCVPISYVAFESLENDQGPIGALHICSAGRKGEIRSEDELFDDFRDLCESVRPLCLTLMLCPAYPMNDEVRERFLTHVKAIFRAAVYGKIRILCGGPCALTVSGAKKCFDAIFEAKELLKKAKHERNTEIQAGLLVSSPLMLCSLDKLPSFDFLCLDIEKLSRLFSGIPARSVFPNEAVCEFVEFLEKIFTDGKYKSPITSAILNEEIKKAIPEKTAVFSGIVEFFVRRK
jgi:hypothetical protein